jgi:hypothetical protein
VAGLYRGFPQDASAGFAAAGRGARGLSDLYGGRADAAGKNAAQALYGGYSLYDRFRQPPETQSPAPVVDAVPTMNPSEFTPGFGGTAQDPWYGRDGGAIRRRYAEGGEVSGPGTGTSDSVSAIKKPGTYILSADTVRAIGTKKVRDIMDKAGVRPGDGEANDRSGIPVRLSNGEWALPPEVTSYYGELFFDKLQQKYHRPVYGAEGSANGGAIRRRALPQTVEDAIYGTMNSQAIRRR